ncbi:MAG: hypothetical protein ACTSU2_11390 [Promethearchaeota archaeon]
MSFDVEAAIKELTNGSKKLGDFSIDQVREMIIAKRHPYHAEDFKVKKIEGEKIYCQLWNGGNIIYIFQDGDFHRKL